MTVHGSIRPMYILGTGLLAQEFFDLARTSGFAVQAFVENLDPAKVGSTLCECSVIWVDALPVDAPCVCALSTTTRTRFIEQVASRAAFATLVHPSSVVLPSTQIGEGTVVSTGVLIGSNSRIGRHVFLNRGSRVGHHTRVGDFVTIQPGANIAGANEIGDETYIGMGAIILERLTIGRGVTVAAGSVVKRDIPDHALVSGSPAVIKKRGVDPR
jgi:sugar O-acyltransferase (sialic acid O-acetyltransferase NeuD family)